MTLPEELDALERAGIQDVKFEKALGVWYCAPLSLLRLELQGEGSTRTEAVRDLRGRLEQWRKETTL